MKCSSTIFIDTINSYIYSIEVSVQITRDGKVSDVIKRNTLSYPEKHTHKGRGMILPSSDRFRSSKRDTTPDKSPQAAASTNIELSADIMANAIQTKFTYALGNLDKFTQSGHNNNQPKSSLSFCKIITYFLDRDLFVL